VFHERRFRWLLRLLPASFREEHERELLRVWRDEASDAARAGRRGVWADALKDTLRVAPREFADTWWRNVRFAARSLRRSPGFTITAVLTLALGTGATAAVFTLVNGVPLRPLPWMEPDRVCRGQRGVPGMSLRSEDAAASFLPRSQQATIL
jgi:hypothetical protein